MSKIKATECKPDEPVLTWKGHKITGYAKDTHIRVERDSEMPTKVCNNLGEAIGIITIKYDVIGAGPVGHPQEVFKKVCELHRITLVEATPHSIADVWMFRCNLHANSSLAYLPRYVTICEE